jgi:hypothetical protein
MSKKKQIAVLISLVLVLLIVAWYYVRSAPSDNLSQTASTRPYAPLGVESPAPHFWEIEQARKTEYSKTLRNIFSSVAPPPEPDKKIVAADHPHQPVGPQKEPPLPPPVLPVTFFGYGTVPNGTSRRAFLTNKEDIYIVAEGDTLLGRFRILRINNANLEFEEISTGQKNTAPLILEESASGAAPAPPPAPTPAPAPTS